MCANHFPIDAWLNQGVVYAIFPGMHEGTHVRLRPDNADAEARQEDEAYVKAWVARGTLCFPCRDAEGASAALDIRRLRRATWAEMAAYIQTGAVPARDPNAPLDVKARIERLIDEFRSAVDGAGAPGAQGGEWTFSLGWDRELRVRTGGTYRVSVKLHRADVVQQPRAADLLPAHEQMARLLLSHGLDLPG